MGVAVALLGIEKKMGGTYLQEFTTYIHTNLRRYCDPAYDLILEKGKFKQKRALLDAARAWQGCEYIRDSLPMLDKMQLEVRKKIATRSRNLEMEIKAAANCDDLNQRIETLRIACSHVDDHISNEGGAQVSHLLSLLEMKRAGIDTALETRINVGDYTGIHKYLSPLATSSDTMQQDKFQKYIRVLDANANELVASLKSHVSSGQAVAEKMPVLENAAEELGELLAEFGSISLSDAAKMIVDAINNNFRSDIIHLEKALSRLDYTTIIMLSQQLHAYFENVNKWLITRLQHRFQKSYDEALSCFEKAEQRVDAFVGAVLHFGETDETLDTSNLHRTLNALRAASDDSGATTQDSSQIGMTYMRLTRKLEGKIGDLYRELRHKVESQQLFMLAIAVVRFLNSESTKGLARHIDFPFDIQSFLEELQQEQQTQTREIQNSLVEKRDISGWATRMDNLFSLKTTGWRSWTIWRSSAWSSSEYDRLANTIKGAVRDLTSRAQSAFEADHFELVKELVTLLITIQAKLGRHVNSAGTSAQQFVGMFVARMRQLCDDMSRALSSRDFSTFEALFAPYANLSRNILGQNTAQQCTPIQKAVHLLLHDFIESESGIFANFLDCYQYTEASHSVAKLRQIGVFMTTTFAVYHDETRRAIEGNPDPCLMKLTEQCHAHFGDAALTKIGRYYAVLEVSPDAIDERDIRRAFHRKSLQWHPDKSTAPNCDEMFRKIKEASEELKKSEVRSRFQDGKGSICAKEIRRVSPQLRHKMAEYLKEGAYDCASAILFNLSDLSAIASLVTPALNAESLSIELHTSAKSCVQRLKIEMEESWVAKRFAKLHQSFSLLECAGTHFSAYPEIYS